MTYLERKSERLGVRIPPGHSSRALYERIVTQGIEERGVEEKSESTRGRECSRSVEPSQGRMSK